MKKIPAVELSQNGKVSAIQISHDFVSDRSCSTFLTPSFHWSPQRLGLLLCIWQSVSTRHAEAHYSVASLHIPVVMSCRSADATWKGNIPGCSIATDCPGQAYCHWIDAAENSRRVSCILARPCLEDCFHSRPEDFWSPVNQCRAWYTGVFRQILWRRRRLGGTNAMNRALWPDTAHSSVLQTCHMN